MFLLHLFLNLAHRGSAVSVTTDIWAKRMLSKSQRGETTSCVCMICSADTHLNFPWWRETRRATRVDFLPWKQFALPAFKDSRHGKWYQARCLRGWLKTCRRLGHTLAEPQLCDGITRRRFKQKPHTLTYGRQCQVCPWLHFFKVHEWMWSAVQGPDASVRNSCTMCQCKMCKGLLYLWSTAVTVQCVCDLGMRGC